jgi:hypothetical protein
MPSEAEEKQFAEAIQALTEFIRILLREYPLVFKNDSGVFKVHPSAHPSFPYEVTLDIRKTE